jgi:RimJ/RimL family protein N-acetyltransferase
VNQIIGMDRKSEAVHWARSRMNLEGPTPGNAYATWSMVDPENNFLAVFVLSDINSHSACMHFAAKPGVRWLTPAFVNGVMYLAFFELGVERLTGPIRERNTRSRQVAEKYGFTLEGIMRKAFPDGEGCCIYSFLKEEYMQHRWFVARSRNV